MGAAGGLLALLGIGARRDFLTPTMAEVSRRSAERRQSRKEDEREQRRISSQGARLDSLLAGPAGTEVKSFLEKQGLKRGEAGFDPSEWERADFQELIRQAGEVVTLSENLPGQIAIAQSEESEAYPKGAPPELGPGPWESANWKQLSDQEQSIALARRKAARAGFEAREENQKIEVADIRSGIGAARDREDESPGGYGDAELEMDLRRIGQLDDASDRADLEADARSLHLGSATNAVANQWQGAIRNRNYAMLDRQGEWTEPERRAASKLGLTDIYATEGNALQQAYAAIRGQLEVEAEGVTEEEFRTEVFGDRRINEAAQLVGSTLDLDYKTAREKAEANGTLGEFVSTLDGLGDIQSAIGRRATSLSLEGDKRDLQRRVDHFASVPGIGQADIAAFYEKRYNRETGQWEDTQVLSIGEFLADKADSFSLPLDPDALNDVEEQWGAAMTKAGIVGENQQPILNLLRDNFDPAGILSPEERDKNLRRIGQPAGANEDDQEGPIEIISGLLDEEAPSVRTDVGVAKSGARGESLLPPTRANIISAIDDWLAEQGQIASVAIDVNPASAVAGASSFGVVGSDRLSSVLRPGNEEVTLAELKEVLSHPAYRARGLHWDDMLHSIGLDEGTVSRALTHDDLAGQAIDMGGLNFSIYREFPPAATDQMQARADKLRDQAIQLGAQSPEGQQLLSQVEVLERDIASLGRKQGLRNAMRPLQAEFFSYLLPHLTTTGERAFDLDEDGVKEFLSDRLGASELGIDTTKIPTGMFKGIDDATLVQQIDMFERFLDAAGKKFLAEPGVASKDVGEVLIEGKESLQRIRVVVENLQKTNAGRNIINIQQRGEEYWGVRGIPLGTDYDKIQIPRQAAYHWLLSAIASHADVQAGRRSLAGD